MQTTRAPNVRATRHQIPRPCKRYLSSRSPLVCLVTLLIVGGFSLSSSAAAYASYDPEQQDGIPVLSARSLNPQPADDWLNGDSDNDHRRRQLQRRNSDPDLDDGIEDDDDDEYQSGSNKHEMIEPTFGESKRAAQDGDEIESFFDKHLGPPQEAGSTEDASNEVPIHTVAGVASSADPDEDDMFEAAASSPLSSIFQSLLSGHRKPFVIHATEESSSSSSSSPGDQSSTATDGSSKAARDPVGSAGSSLRGSSTPAVHHYTQQVAPIAFLTPVASPSSIEAYESQANEAADDVQDQQQAPVREIYIGRRPAVAKYIQQAGYSASNPRAMYGYQQHHNHNHHQQAWRGSPSMMYSQSGRPSAYEQSEHSADYSRYPVAASYAYQREQPQQSPDDGQTVTYGLSFGASSGADETNEDGPSVGMAGTTDSAASTTSSQDDSPAGYEQSGQQAAGYMPAYNERELMRYKTSSTRAHNNYHQNAAMLPAGYVRVPQQAGYLYQQQQQFQQQSPYHGSRYHRDPSEAQLVGVVRGHPYSVGGGAAAGQSFREANNQNEASQTRQQLLADLSKEITASPYYQRQADVLARRPDRQMTSSSQKINKGLLNADLDTYDSYHTEVDPYKTFTSTSKMVRYPGRLGNDNIVPVESGSQRIPANAEQQPGNSGVTSDGQQWAANANSTDGSSSQKPLDAANGPVLTGPISHYEPLEAKTSSQTSDDHTASGRSKVRVRRDDLDEREGDADDDDDGVWVDDDDDDNKQQSSDLNETSQEPDEDDQSQEQYEADPNNQQMAQVSPPGVIGAPHGYELSPNDLMIYHG